MKNFAYARRVNRELSVHTYKDDMPAEPSAYSGLMMNRLDFDIKILEIPPAGDDEIENLLNYRIRSIYPGDPENTRFDYRIISKNKKRYAILFITSREYMEQYRRLAGSRSLILPYTLIENHRKNRKSRNAIYLFWDHNWIDILIYNEGILTSSTAIKREKEHFVDILKIKNILPQNYQNYEFFNIHLKAENDALIDKARDLYNDIESREYILIEDLFTAFSGKLDTLFRKKIKIHSIARKIRVDILLIPILLLICLIFNAHVENQIKYRKLLEKTHMDKLAQSQTQQKYQLLQNELNALRKKQPQDVYLLLSELSREMGGDAILSRFRFKADDSTFYLEGEALKAEEYSKALTNNKLFKSAQISEIIPDPAIKKDKFKLTGVFNANQ